MHANGRHHTRATKHIARRINRQDRRTARETLRANFDAVMNYQPRGRAVYDSY